MHQLGLKLIVLALLQRIGFGKDLKPCMLDVAKDLDAFIDYCAWASGNKDYGSGLAAPWKCSVADRLMFALEEYRTTKVLNEKAVSDACAAAEGRY